MREPDRDRSIAEMLRRAGPRTPASDPSDRCVDAETLAAWIDGDLTAAEVNAAETHVSSCARCQAMVAAIVRTAPSTAAVVPWWRRGWAIGALVPLTAGAAAIAIYIAMPDVQERAAPATVARQASSATATPSPEEQRQQPAAAERQRPALRTPQPAPSTEAVAAPPAEARANAFAAPRAAETEQAKKEAADAARRDEPASASTPAQAAPPPSAAALEAAAASRLRDAAAADAPQREAVMARSAAVAKSAFAPAEIISPDRSARWRPGAAGSIERSTDAGATWIALSSGVTEDLTAGSAPSSTACWIVGRRGTVLVSDDGVRWRRVAFPEPADLVAVQATDLATAIVTAADGRRFRTADGGQTWTLSGPFPPKRY